MIRPLRQGLPQLARVPNPHVIYLHCYHILLLLQHLAVRTPQSQTSAQRYWSAVTMRLAPLRTPPTLWSIAISCKLPGRSIDRGRTSKLRGSCHGMEAVPGSPSSEQRRHSRRKRGTWPKSKFLGKLKSTSCISSLFLRFLRWSIAGHPQRKWLSAEWRRGASHLSGDRNPWLAMELQ